MFDAPNDLLIIGGRGITATVSMLESAAVAALVWLASPPPNTAAEFMTDVGELSATFTVSVMSGKLPPAPATTAFDVHVTALLPEQFQPVPLKVLNVYPDG